MSEVQDLRNRIQFLEEKIARQNQGLLDIPKEKFSDYVCGTVDIERTIKEGENPFALCY